MKIHIETTDEQHKKLKYLKIKENRTMQYLISKAINNFLIAKKITAWDVLPKSEQKSLKNKAKDLVKKA